MNLHFVVNIACSDRTRLLHEPDKLTHDLELIIGTFFRTWTQGPMPAATVKHLNTPEAILAAEAIVAAGERFEE